jgi:hypothetical protein
MKNILILIGGWHFPYEFYKQISQLNCPENCNIKKFVVSHRNPEIPLVYNEKLNFIRENVVNELDLKLYSQCLTKKNLEKWNIEYKEYPNVIGDFYFINQYFSDHTELPDYLFFFHDDNYITNLNLVSDIVNNTVDSYFFLENKQVKPIKNDDWLHIGNCFYENRLIPRGSFNVFKKEILLEKDLFLKFDNVTLNREHCINSPDPENLGELADWNNVCRNFGQYMIDKNICEKSYRLSPVRRVSRYLLECQRGFLRNLN